jgi:hypothetical protein
MACSMSVASRAGICGGWADVDTDWKAVTCTVWMCIVGSCTIRQRNWTGAWLQSTLPASGVLRGW